MRGIIGIGFIGLVIEKSGQYSHNKIIEQLNTWMDWLETPNEDFGGMRLSISTT